MLGLALFPFAFPLFVLLGFLGLFVFSNQEKKRSGCDPTQRQTAFL